MKDKARRYVQGVIENLELIWIFEDETDEDHAVMQKELDAIAKRIGKSRTFVSSNQ